MTSRRRTLERAMADLQRSSRIARACGAAMYSDGVWDWLTLVPCDFDLTPYLSDRERHAFESIGRALWWSQWHHGWNDAAAAAELDRELGGPHAENQDRGARVDDAPGDTHRD